MKQLELSEAFLKKKGTIDAEQLLQLWEKGGKPLKMQALADLLKKAGLSERQIAKSFKGVGIKYKPDPEEMAKDDAAAGEDAGTEKTQTKGNRTTEIISKLASLLSPEQKQQLSNTLRAAAGKGERRVLGQQT